MDAMVRESTGYEDESEIFEVASEFDNPVVRRYAAVLRDANVTLKSFQRSTIVEELGRCGIAEIPAGDIVCAFRKHLQRGSVGVFWDLENVGLPPNVRPMEALTALRDVIINKFGEIKEFKAYVDLAVFAHDFSPETRVLFRDCGVEMVDAPHNRRKEVADKHIIVDALWFALHVENPIVCIISGDSDFSPLLSKLKMNEIPTIVISTSHHVRSLRQQSTWALSWPESFLPGAEAPRDPGQRNRSGGFVANSSPQRRAVSPASTNRSSPLTKRSRSPPSYGMTTTPSSLSAASGQDIVPPPSISVDAASAQTAPAMRADFSDLIDCIKQVQDEVKMKRVRRSAVGLLFKRLNPVVPCKTVMSEAALAGLIEMGGELGHAWVALSSDHVDSDKTPAEVKAASTTTVVPQEGTGGWWVTLRFNQSFQTFPSLMEFRPAPEDRVQVLRVREPQGNWHRMGVGPFETLMAADNYYTLNFGEMKLLPKITQNIKKYVDPNLFPQH